MQNLEKRVSPRQSLQIPVRFRSLELASPEPELASETSNISRSGLFMKSPLHLKVGSTLAITLRVPTYLSGSARSMVQCIGRVVHERELTNGDIGYGVQFEYLLSFQRSAVPLSATSPSPSVSSHT